MPLLRHPKDWISLTHVGFVLVSIFGTFILASAEVKFWWVLAIVATITGIYTNYVAHNHSHRGMSDFPTVNWVLDLILGFTSGTPMVFWRVNHVKNHHGHENTPEDWTSYHTFEGCSWPSKAVPLWYYCATFTLLVFCHCTIHVMRRPFSKEFYEYFLSLGVIVIVNLVLLFWSWQAWVLTNGMIYVFAPFFLGYANYFHHYACPAQRGIKASNDFTNHWQNALAYNIGFHIEHTMSPAIHWSELPAFHQKHKHKIPFYHIEPNFFPGASAFWQSNQWLEQRLASNRTELESVEPWT